MASSSSATGVVILKGSKPKWRVGKKLGSGACAIVHSLEEADGSPTEYAIKLAPLPIKITKKQNSDIEVNATKLYYEHVVYRNQFQDILGKFVPKLPPYGKGPPSNGEAGGFRFLIMEKMECELDKVVPLLLKADSSSTVNFGPVAAQLLACVQAIQERKHVVVDIKPDNFMLANGKGTGTSPTQKLASRIRLLDLALVQPWSSIGSHRANEGTSGLAGTPLYASLNIHNGETPSRRDDLESLGYVIAELLIKLVSGDESKQLPWSHGRSDEDIGAMKQKFVEDLSSEFYKKLLGGGTVAKVFAEYIQEVRAYTFKKKPDYGVLEKILLKLKVPVAASKAKKTTRAKRAPASSSTVNKRSSATAAATSKRMTRSNKRAASHGGENESPKKVARDESFMDCDVIEISDDEDQWTDAQQPEPPVNEFHDAQEGTEMDWEPTDENEEPAVDSKPKALDGVTILIESGPHKGQAINLIKGKTEAVIVGSNPSTTAGQVPFVLAGDDDIDSSHIKLDLTLSKKLVSVNVTDLKSTGTYVGSEKIRKGKEYRIFRGDSVRIGNTLLTVKTLDPNVTVSTNQESKNSGKRRATKPNVTKEAGLKRRGVRLVVTAGPHMGESFELEHGGTETFTVGSKPSSKIGNLVSLKKDKSLKASHVRLDLTVAKKLVTVAITDKSKGDTLVNNNTVNKGRAFINDIITIGDSVLEIKSL